MLRCGKETIRNVEYHNDFDKIIVEQKEVKFLKLMSLMVKIVEQYEVEFRTEIVRPSYIVVTKKCWKLEMLETFVIKSEHAIRNIKNIY